MKYTKNKLCMKLVFLHMITMVNIIVDVKVTHIQVDLY